MEKELASATSTAAIMQAEKSKLQQEVQESKKEQDDLLMLLADQDQKILSLKQKLKDLGETVHSSQQSRTLYSSNVFLASCISSYSWFLFDFFHTD